MTNDPLDKYRDSLATVHMDTPAVDIVARGDRLVPGAAWASGPLPARVAQVLTIALTLLVTGGSDHTGPELAAFTLRSAPAGGSTLTLHKNSATRLDPDALRRALAERGIAAKVTVGSWCDTATEPNGLHEAITCRVARQQWRSESDHSSHRNSVGSGTVHRLLPQPQRARAHRRGLAAYLCHGPKGCRQSRCRFPHSHSSRQRIARSMRSSGH